MILLGFLEIQNVRFSYGQQRNIIDHVSWQIEKGEFHCLLGRSGCGKTTLLKLAAGLLQGEDGQIMINNKKVTKPSNEYGFVFQSPTLLEWKTAIENVLLPIKLKRKIKEQDQLEANNLLAQVGLAEHIHKFPSELSGGQQSRVAIARALIHKPIILFLDEPFAALDAITREELQHDLLQLCKEQETTVLFITHDISEAVFLADRIAVMDRGKIIFDTIINLERPRLEHTRYSVSFNTYSKKIRDVLGSKHI
ncbi:ABC transporter ATP-binding protein [Cytobacillus gottheilii]|uniref:ABC transporter ATP-binding protein n=1 Tax=Cytobacillus gottheilii TaxID=859144 RepID=UPI0035300AB4